LKVLPPFRPKAHLKVEAPKRITNACSAQRTNIGCVVVEACRTVSCLKLLILFGIYWI
jgi:hypothetical protein